jgi:DNA-binding NtrC family response regulator
MPKQKPKVLIIDDQNRYVELAHALLRDYDYATRCELAGPCWECSVYEGCALTHAHDWSETVQTFSRHPDVDVVLLDLAFDLPKERLLMTEGGLERSRRLQGIEILKRIRRAYGDLPVVLMTSLEELRFEDAAEALEVDEFAVMAGADAFDARALGMLVERILARKGDVEESPGYLFGGSAAMKRLRKDAMSLARTSLPMLIDGEPGTGKSALAENVVHPETGRKGPFVVLDLGAIPEGLMAAELFGSVRGAFSGAVDRAGAFEHAEGGTLFLDEIGNLPLEVQRMLLVSLQSGQIRRLGQNEPKTIDVKLVAATNTDLKTAVRGGRFRADLFSRLNPAARVTLPPLRDRMGDLGALASLFIRKTFAHPQNRSMLNDYLAAAALDDPPRVDIAIGGGAKPSSVGVTFAISRRTLGYLKTHPWPGNIRELELLMANAAVFSLSDALTAAREGRATAEQPRTVPISSKLIRELLDTTRPDAGLVMSEGSDGISVQPKPADSMHSLMRQVETRILKNLFEETDGDFRIMAARLLTGDPKANERRVRLRFNQLGLRVRDFSKRKP